MDFKRILVAIDDGDPALHAADAAITLAGQVDANLAFVTVVPTALMPPNELGFVEPRLMEQLHARAQSLLRLVRDRAGNTPSDEISRTGVVAEEIAAAAREWNADLIVIGNHNRPLLERLLLGNTTKGVLHAAPCPVLVVEYPGRKPASRCQCASVSATS
jgi:nucleotide-binding universal stress UspA family protein